MVDRLGSDPVGSKRGDTGLGVAFEHIQGQLQDEAKGQKFGAELVEAGSISQLLELCTAVDSSSLSSQRTACSTSASTIRWWPFSNAWFPAQ